NAWCWFDGQRSADLLVSNFKEQRPINTAQITKQLRRTAEEERTGIIGSWIVQVDEHVHPAMLGPLRTLSLSTGNFRKHRGFIPVAIVIARILFLSAVAGDHVVNVHDGDNHKFGMFCEPACGALLRH